METAESYLEGQVSGGSQWKGDQSGYEMISGEGMLLLRESSWGKDSIALMKMSGKFLPDPTESFAELRGKS